MFTGIIENTGIIKKWQPLPTGGKFFVAPRKAMTKVKTGESIAINGCCLTVVSHKNNQLEFDVSDETMRKTAFSQYHSGMKVNLERAMKASNRFGGHFVLGHVDGVGTIKEIVAEKGSVRFRISYPKGFSHLLIEKGSVTIDGISLTVCGLAKSHFDIYVIPHTLKETSLETLKTGSSVNLEFDVLGKYVERMIKAGTNPSL